MPQISAIIPDQLHEKIKNESSETGKSKAQIIRERLENGYEEGSQELIKEKNERIKNLEDQIKEVKKNRRNALQDKEDKIQMLQEKIDDKEDRINELKDNIKHLQEELHEEKEETATFGEWVTSINPLARFFIKTGLMISGWKIPERVKENKE